MYYQEITLSFRQLRQRYISNARSKQHTSNLFAEHKILKFHDLVKHCELSFMYKYVYSILPSSFNDMFVKLNSFDRSLSFQMEVVKKSFMKTLPAYTLTKNWNNLPLELKRIKSLNVFKNSNKEKILSSYNFSCTANNCYSCQSQGFLTLVLSHLRLKSYNCDNKYSDLKRVSLCAVTPLLNSWVLLLTDPSLNLL